MTKLKLDHPNYPDCTLNVEREDVLSVQFNSESGKTTITLKHGVNAQVEKEMNPNSTALISNNGTFSMQFKAAIPDVPPEISDLLIANSDALGINANLSFPVEGTLGEVHEVLGLE